jgi:hypothetical protein
MENRNTVNHHADYMDVERYWSPSTEPYAGCDNLVTALHDGWEMDGEVLREEKSYAGMRQINIYHVKLQRAGEAMTMPVLANPYIERVLANHSVRVVASSGSD